MFKNSKKQSEYRETAKNCVKLSTTHPNYSKTVKNVEKL